MRDPLVWLFNDFDGLTRLDNLKLFMVKFLYVGLRVLLRVLLGKDKRDQLYITRKLDFGVFWYKANKYLGSYSSKKLLRFKSRKYDYKFYCRNNKDDFKIMTIHEDEIIDKFTPKTGDTVIDVGAHLGIYTIIASRKVGLNGKVISIEADPGNFEILNQNIVLNQLENVTALNFAAYSKEEELKLYLQDGESGFTKYNTVMKDFSSVGEKFVSVKAKTLDDLIVQAGVRHDEVNWVKIDVEGAEFEVLKGAHNILSKSKEISVLIEVHGDRNHYRPKLDEIIKLYKFDIEFEKTYKENESMHIVLHKKNQE